MTLLIDVLQGPPSLKSSSYSLGEFSANLCRLLRDLRFFHGSGIHDQPGGKADSQLIMRMIIILMRIRFIMIDRGDRSATSLEMCHRMISTAKLSADADRREPAKVTCSGDQGEYSTQVGAMHNIIDFCTNDLPVNVSLLHASVCVYFYRVGCG